MKKYTAHLIIALFLLLTVLISPKAALASSLYLSPGGGNISIGGVRSVQVRLNTGGEGVNGVSAFLFYPTDKLEVAWVGGGSAFAIEAEKSYGGGIIKISRGNINPVSGNVAVATIGFRGKSAGQATVAFIGGSAAPRASDSSDSLNLGASRGGVYSVAQGSAVSQDPSKGPVIEDGKGGGAELKLDSINIEEVATNSATISWKTSYEADSIIEYGFEKDAYFLTASDSKKVLDHLVKIENPALVPGLKFHFRVKSTGDFGSIVSSDDMVFQLKGYPLKVKVVDKNNKPLSGIEVFLYSEPVKAVTDTLGEALFVNVTPGKHVVVLKDNSIEKTGEINIEQTNNFTEPAVVSFQLDRPLISAQLMPVFLAVFALSLIALTTLVTLVIIQKRQSSQINIIGSKDNKIMHNQTEHQRKT